MLALTQYDEQRFVKQMLKYGADGYILKSAGKHEILKAISSVKNGHVCLTQEAEAKAEGLRTAEEPDHLFPHLSDREKEIIKLLCHEYNTKQIAEAVHLSAHTIESHRSNIFKKVGVTNVAGLVRWAVNNGLD
ncbi:MAG: response regulator transcription factor [Flavobacteriales bacterium]|nr:response regulator transcription factor [Flavobacteriales bacterium]MBT3964027.1 response regulator transcription factor [Flavobacteriales bacterium]MBT4704509.1 response regulator transcription factor [Flavobacteriales bacterium]MBT4931264.1 response regulator transcription factor [Flavobacteriales bacterium]MBT5131907.1 response regulator transcription factor [Flavobacteriales bacterium]